MTDEKKVELTEANSHRATERGYGMGQLIEPGCIVPAGVPVSESWMDEIEPKDRKLAAAVEDAQKRSKDDPDLTKLSKPALEALATERGVTDVSGLTRENLIAAIKAAAEPGR